jgi:hypothetical protein
LRAARTLSLEFNFSSFSGISQLKVETLSGEKAFQDFILRLFKCIESARRNQYEKGREVQILSEGETTKFGGGKVERVILGMDGLTAQGRENVFQLLACRFKIQGIRAKINLITPDKFAKCTDPNLFKNTTVLPNDKDAFAD